MLHFFALFISPEVVSDFGVASEEELVSELELPVFFDELEELDDEP